MVERAEQYERKVMRIARATDRWVWDKLVPLVLDKKKVVYRPFEKYVAPLYKTVRRTLQTE